MWQFVAINPIIDYVIVFNVEIYQFCHIIVSSIVRESLFMNLFLQKTIIQNDNNLQKCFGELSKIPCLVLIKDTNLKYAITSDHLAMLLGWKNAEQCIGQTDCNIPNNIVLYANEFITLDQKVIKKKENLLVLHIVKITSVWKQYIISKTLIQNLEGEVTGIYTQAIEVTPGIGSLYMSLNAIDQKLYGNKDESIIYNLSQAYSPLPLTPKQQECVFLMIRGKTAKEIARAMKINPRTVETHVSDIKLRLGCYSHSQIIEKALDSGFLSYIPYNIVIKHLKL